ncbi:helix-turn-helix domain-containing protein [Aneurinibacillus migulanus]
MHVQLFVLGKFCKALNCKIEDIIEYRKDEN